MFSEIWKEITSDIEGIRTLNEWFGDGGEPVLQSQADSRALVCAKCPRNKKGNWWDRMKGIVADNIRRHMSVKNRLNLSTVHDPEIGTCGVCDCNLPLKVWVPLNHIKNHTSIITLEEFPADCWVKNEIQNL